jgi:glycosyltransferase involved in cell wall biosynthesis
MTSTAFASSSMSGKVVEVVPKGSRISVIVPSWRRPDRLRECLEALRSQSVAPFEVLVVLRPDDRGTRDVLSAGPVGGIRIVEVEEPGLVASLNAGLASARGEIIAFTDDDATPRPDWIARIDDHFAAEQTVGGVGGRDLIPGQAGATAATVGRVTPYGRLVGNHHLGSGSPRPVDFLKGVNMAFRAAAARDLEFDARLIGRGAQPHSEIGFCLRLKRRRWTLIYDPSVLVEHRLGARPVYERGSTAPFDVTVEAHNELLGLLTGLTGLRRVIAVGYALIVGSRKCPGPLLAVERIVAAREGWEAVIAMRAATAGRLKALSSARSGVDRRG